MSNHYVFLNPGEKIYVLTDRCAGETDYTYVIEVEIPVHPHRDTEGRQYHNPKTGHIVDVCQYRVLESNDCANLVTGDYPGATVLEAFARVNEKGLGNDPDAAFVANPVGEWQGVRNDQG